MDKNYSSNSFINSDDTLWELFDRFGPALLVPLATDNGEPLEKDWAQTTFEKTQETPYLRRLSQTSIGVATGSASNNLCALRIQDADALREFIKANPTLTKTLMTTGPQGAVLWLRLTGFYPKTQVLTVGSWFADGALVPVFNRNRFVAPYEFSGGNRPMEIEFDDLKWNAPDKASLLPQLLVAQYGSPVSRDERNKIKINYNYWAYLFCVEAKLVYHPGQKQFLRWHSEQGLLPVHDELVLRELRTFLFAASQRTGLQTLKRSLFDHELRAVLKHMRIVAVTKLVEEQNALATFINEGVVPEQGANVTSQELFLAYSAYCRNHRFPALIRHEFLCQSPAIIRQRFGIPLVHRIKRDNSERRGYLHLRLKPFEAVVGTAWTSGTEAFG